MISANAFFFAAAAQVPSLILTTASEGIDIFKPANMDVLLPPAADGAGADGAAAADGVAVD